MREIVFTRQFVRDFRRLKRRLPRETLEYETFEYIIELLASTGTVPEAFREHGLAGDLVGFLECHVDADWLLIYRVKSNRVVFHRTGTHRDLFRRRKKR